MGGAFAKSPCIKDGVYLVAKRSGCRIKANLTKIVLDVLVTTGNGLGCRRAKVQCLAVWGKHRIGFIVVRGRQQAVEEKLMGGGLIVELVARLG